MDEKFYSAAEVAQLLKLKKNTVYDMIRRGEIQSVKLGKQFRISQSILEDLLGKSDSHTPAAAPSSVLNIKRDVVQPKPELVAQREQSREGFFIICGQDPSLDIITGELAAYPAMPPILRSYAGSYNGLYQLYRGSVDVCTSHLWDERTKSYNIPFLEHLLPGMNVISVRLFGRMTGFYVAKGNPKGIKSWDDLRRSELSYVNRESGSGTRVLLDAKLKSAGISPSKLRGYVNIKTSFMSVATVIASGEADFGLGMEAASRLNTGIEFIPLQKEWVDMIFPAEPINIIPYELLLDYVSSEHFIITIRQTGDYDFSETGRIFRQ